MMMANAFSLPVQVVQNSPNKIRIKKFVKRGPRKVNQRCQANLDTFCALCKKSMNSNLNVAENRDDILTDSSGSRSKGLKAKISIKPSSTSLSTFQQTKLQSSLKFENEQKRMSNPIAPYE